MPQTTLNLPIEEAYTKLKANLTQKSCIIASEDAPKRLVVKHGSLWGLSPRTAKKTIEVTLKEKTQNTTVTYNSKLASDWKNITIVGCIVAVILAGFCIWMALDLSQFMFDGNPSFWGWIITTDDTVKFQAGEAFVNLTWGLAVFLSIVVSLEAAIYVYASRNLELFAKETITAIA